MNTGPRKIFCYILLAFIHTFYASVTNAQSYGLGFSSHEVIQDKRTSLELLPGADYCTQHDFEISFDLTILPSRRDYFGYILRVVKNEQEYIDLLYDVRPEGNQFKIVVGGKFTNIAFALDTTSLFYRWNQLHLRFDLQNDQVVLNDGKRSFIQNKIGLKPGDCFKFFFGASQYKQAKITDVPPMKIRDVKIIKAGETRYWWPLDEREGPAAIETISGKDAIATNPIWIRNTHYEWRLAKQLTVRRSPSFAFNPGQGILYLVASDSLYNYSSRTGELSAAAYPSGQQLLLRGNQSLFVNSTSSLYNIYLDHHLVTAYNFTQNDWDKKYKAGPVTDFWHFNKFYSPLDTSIYILNGYGHFQYRDTIRRYHIPTATWSTVATTGDKLLPRYLAAAGATQKGDGIYLLGGYGSETGQQILAPKSYYDMLFFDAGKRTIKKLFEIKPGKEDFVMANSLVIDEPANTWYGLAYPNYKYSSQLQVLRGSLNDPAYTTVGNTIPFSFRDVNSFADLFYCPLSKQLIAVTSLQATTDNNGTYTINIYTLAAPPVGPGEPTATSSSTGWPWWVWVFPVLVLAGAILAFTQWRKKKQLRPSRSVSSQPDLEPSPAFIFPPTDPEAASNQQSEILNPKSEIHLFGEMQVVDQEGADITKQFTPLVKELFLIILLHSVRKGRGVSSDKLTEMLWFDKSAQSARNNRSVNIAKLKSILDKLPDCQLSNETGAWKIEIAYDKISVDFYEYLQVVQDKTGLTRQKINQLAAITQRGAFLSHLEYPWLAPFKAEVSNDIIDTYLSFAATMAIGDDPEFLVKLANDIFYFDPVNEDAMAIKCKALVHQGKHSLAKKAFESFAKEYKAIYGEDFSHDFQSILEA
ncbi:galactose oxidase [Paraflavitalea soli]|uniref:Galactose oxidase n=1 Tax=Paraflavitalea soli TaxID=2315862 RepID=A0A3B7MTR0_9BACT|nr:galactose oxidase [Paraflavitalea soli]AXY77934.1 galactose oxidase [Paraflavitalea soli]